MARLDEQFNADQHEEQQSFEPLPAGEYPAHVTDSDIKDTKKGDGKYIKLTWEILDGPFAGRLVFENYNYINSSAQAAEIGQRDFASACRALGRPNVTDTEQLHAIPAIIKLKIQPGKDGYAPQNKIAKYSPVSAGIAQPPAAQQAAPPPPGYPPVAPPNPRLTPAAQAYAAPPTAPANPQGRPPWQTPAPQ